MGASLSIGDLAQRTGLAPGTVRMWETRHGFPASTRLASGHRRYSEDDVSSVLAVVAHRDAGLRLEHAIARVVGTREPVTESVFGQLRRVFPQLETHRLRKTTLSALSRAFEDEFSSRGARGTLWGAFQEERHYRPVRPRWESMARMAERVVVLADFSETRPDGPVVEVAVAPSSPLRQEWVLVIHGPEVAVALGAWEVSGQAEVPEPDRVFEALWSPDADVVHEAARVCTAAARAAGAELEPPADVAASDPAVVTSMFNRVVAYLDR